jgi:oligopeptide transport system permease protein
MAFAVFFGLLFGIITAIKNNSAVDYIISGITVFFISIPAYVIALFLQYFLAFKPSLSGVRVFPISGWGTFSSTVLPALAIGLSLMVSITKYMKSSMVEVIGQDYIKTAKAKGISNRAIVWKHTVRNAILPVVTILGPMLVGIIMGTVIIEMIFGIPGIGSYFVSAITNQDYPMIMGTTIFYSIFLVFTNFIVDLLYGVIDPRIRVAGRG